LKKKISLIFILTALILCSTFLPSMITIERGITLRNVGNFNLLSNNLRTVWTQNGIPICSLSETQTNPEICSDGNGGIIVVWCDFRDNLVTNYDIYAQRIAANGSLLWTTTGVPICTGNYTKTDLQICSDGNGGAIIAWTDYRQGINSDIYAQRINILGVTQWTANGTIVANHADQEYSTQIVYNGSNGAVIVWQRLNDIYAQNIGIDGNTLWTANGTIVCNDGSIQKKPVIASGGSGTSIIAWEDNRNGDLDIYIDKIGADGNSVWFINGKPICTEVNDTQNINIISSGSGANLNAILVWEDQRITGNPDCFYAQKVDHSGAPRWADNGTALSSSYTLPPESLYADLCSDGYGGAFFTWVDWRGTSRDIYAQRINYNGNAQWGVNGTLVCGAANSQRKPQMSSSSDGVIITWEDERNGASNDDVYAQILSWNGTILGSADGIAISTQANGQSEPKILVDTFDHVFIVWEDNRNSEFDIYGQRVFYRASELTLSELLILIFLIKSEADPIVILLVFIRFSED